MTDIIAYPYKACRKRSAWVVVDSYGKTQATTKDRKTAEIIAESVNYVGRKYCEERMGF